MNESIVAENAKHQLLTNVRLETVAKTTVI